MNTHSSTEQPRWRYHPDREAVITEPHARPSLPVSSTDFIVHLGFSCNDADLNRLVEKLDSGTTGSSRRHYTRTFDKVRIKLEHHTEFISLTCQTRGGNTRDDIYTVLDSLLGTSRVEMIAMTQIIMCDSETRLQEQLPENHTVYGGSMRGAIKVRSSLVPNYDGCLVYVVHAQNGPEEETGRRVQRLLEMETYRTMCLLGLPAARRCSERLQSLERGVNQVITQMNTDRSEHYQDLFNTLTQLSQDNNRLLADTRFRFSASRAYFDLAQQRLDSLEEKKDHKLQTISGFVRSRLEPGMATIDSVAKRQTTLAEDLNNALTLLRTRIDIGLNRDNQALLKSMDARHRQQVVIAQAVEGLSAVAITYYTIGLISYAMKGVKSWLPVSQNLAIALSVPIVLACVWSFLHYKRTKWEKEFH